DVFYELLSDKPGRLTSDNHSGQLITLQNRLDQHRQTLTRSLKVVWQDLERRAATRYLQGEDQRHWTRVQAAKGRLAEVIASDLVSEALPESLHRNLRLAEGLLLWQADYQWPVQSRRLQQRASDLEAQLANAEQRVMRVEEILLGQQHRKSRIARIATMQSRVVQHAAELQLAIQQSTSSLLSRQIAGISDHHQKLNAELQQVAMLRAGLLDRQLSLADHAGKQL
ncbi:MAG: hypothetical protein KDI36_15610, partial [Pseudomonadales bacterium]|nr:hypothetical protein [Pseudomonadales bacterium]